MSVFDQFTDGINTVARNLSSKAQEFTDTAKLNSRIKDANALIKSTYMAIGEAVYKKSGEDAQSEFAEQFKVIREAAASIEQYQDQINKIKKLVVCPKCGAAVSSEASFCSKCGAKMEKAPEEEKKEAGICPVCGEPLEADALFCPSCGASLSKEKQEDGEDVKEE